MATRREERLLGPSRMYRPTQHQQLWIVYEDDLAQIGCPVRVLDDPELVALRDIANEECWLMADLLEAWKRTSVREASS